MRILNPSDVAHVVDDRIIDGGAVLELDPTPGVLDAIERGVIHEVPAVPADAPVDEDLADTASPARGPRAKDKE